MSRSTKKKKAPKKTKKRSSTKNLVVAKQTSEFTFTENTDIQTFKKTQFKLFLSTIPITQMDALRRAVIYFLKSLSKFKINNVKCYEYKRFKDVFFEIQFDNIVNELQNSDNDLKSKITLKKKKMLIT